MSLQHPVLDWLDDQEAQARCYYDVAVELNDHPKVVQARKRWLSRVRLMRDAVQLLVDERDALLLQDAPHEPSDEGARTDAIAGLIAAGNRVTTAFRSHGRSNGIVETIHTQRECEASMLALDAALHRVGGAP